MSYARIRGRADTDDAKKQICEAIYRVWRQHPNLRLGQLIFNATAGKNFPSCNTDYHQVIFNIEDDDLVKRLIRYPERETDHDRHQDD